MKIETTGGGKVGGSDSLRRSKRHHRKQGVEIFLEGKKKDAQQPEDHRKEGKKIPYVEGLTSINSRNYNRNIK